MSMSTPVPFRTDMGIPIWVCPEKPIQDPYSNFFVQFSLEKADSSSTTRVFILSFLLQCFTSFVIDFKNKNKLIKLNKKHIKNIT